MTEFVQSIADAMSNSLGASLAVVLLSMIPVAEARFAIPFGISMGLNPGQAFGYAFLGSSLVAPILILVFMPIVNALSRTKFFSKIGKFMYEKFEKRSRALAKKHTPAETIDPEQENRRKKMRSDIKKMGGIAIFVGIPLPLTGVYTGSCISSIIRMGFVKSLIGIIIGNAVACGIITLISYLFIDYVNWITLAFFIIAATVILIVIIKLIVYKPKEATADENDSDPENKE